MDTFGIIFLLMITVIGWLMAVFWHRTCQVNSNDAIQLPWLISIVFGCVRRDHVLNWRGVVLQIGIYVFTPVYIQVPLGHITYREAFDKLIWPFLILGVLVFIFSFRRK